MGGLPPFQTKDLELYMKFTLKIGFWKSGRQPREIVVDMNVQYNDTIVRRQLILYDRQWDTALYQLLIALQERILFSPVRKDLQSPNKDGKFKFCALTIII